ncbi:hypothetical protein [Streptomyces glaucescens]|uniref:Uncharacterized protein n=1 Tax=Streptomyces glaucescens TaxID=1907 RepID=A0A089XDA4_STRGA|nr:hypothetical protein [Streptomyces glaucescens]AIS01943.1 hypothetical protein SGLAU_30045 [Streptomyces glaucescens]
MSAEEKHPDDKHSHDHDRRGEQPETAFEEVLQEILDEERRVRDTDEQRRRRGEAGEAITPNTRAQEESEGE